MQGQDQVRDRGAVSRRRRKKLKRSFPKRYASDFINVYGIDHSKIAVFDIYRNRDRLKTFDQPLPVTNLADKKHASPDGKYWKDGSRHLVEVAARRFQISQSDRLTIVKEEHFIILEQNVDKTYVLKLYFMGNSHVFELETPSMRLRSYVYEGDVSWRSAYKGDRILWDPKQTK